MSKHLNEQFLDYLKYMDKTMRADNAAGHQWKYCNSTSKKAKGFEAARKARKYLINCVDGPQWAMKAIGLNCISWYGGNGKIVWLNENSKANVQKHFEIISTGGKTVRQLYEQGKLCDGDILLGYQGVVGHTNVYYGDGKSFDSGHAYCTGSGEGAKFRQWIGNLAHSYRKVNYIFRFKDRAHYRVQCGAFTSFDKFKEMVEKLNKAGFKTMQVVEDGQYKVQVGYFSGKTNAKKYAEKLSKKGFSAMVVEASKTKATEVTADTVKSDATVKPTTNTVPTSKPAQNTTPTTPAASQKNKVLRVQVGAFKTALARNMLAKKIKKNTGLDTFYEKKDGMYYLFCGSFTAKEKADERMNLLKKNNIPCLIKEWQI